MAFMDYVDQPVEVVQKTLLWRHIVLFSVFLWKKGSGLAKETALQGALLATMRSAKKDLNGPRLGAHHSPT